MGLIKTSDGKEIEFSVLKVDDSGEFQIEDKNAIQYIEHVNVKEMKSDKTLKIINKTGGGYVKTQRIVLNGNRMDCMQENGDIETRTFGFADVIKET